MAHRLAVIGLGIMGRRMLDNVLQHPAFEVSGVWDPSAESVAKTRASLPGVTIRSSAEAAMQGADVVYLACPPGPRKSYALQAAAAGQGWRREKGAFQMERPRKVLPWVKAPPGRRPMSVRQTTRRTRSAAALAAGAAVKDPSGAEIGVIAGDGTAADGSATVLVSQGDKKFALPRNSLSVGADGMVSTTATKAQIDATLAGALKAK